MQTLTYPEHPGFKAQGTSAEAALGAAQTAPAIREAILKLLRVYRAGLTPDEAAAHLQLSPLAVRPRFSELAAASKTQPAPLIEPTGQKRLNKGHGGRPGKRAMVWRLVPQFDPWWQGKQMEMFAFEVGRPR
jgi:hypothetical protein